MATAACAGASERVAREVAAKSGALTGAFDGPPHRGAPADVTEQPGVPVTPSDSDRLILIQVEATAGP